MKPAAVETAETDPTFGRILFQREKFLCDHDGALYWPKKNCLIVSDLHLEKGTSTAASGNLIPPYDTGETLNRLHTCIQRWNPEQVICLGDSFHRDDSESRLPLQYRDQLTELMQGKDWVWITGNHDPSVPVSSSGLQGVCREELDFGTIQFRHEQKPHLNDTDLFGSDLYDTDLFTGNTGEISGHLHPCAIIHRRGKRLRRRCFAGDQHRLILPAFGAFTGGLNVFHKAYRGLFKEDKLRVWMLGQNQVYELSGSQLSR